MPRCGVLTLVCIVGIIHRGGEVNAENRLNSPAKTPNQTKEPLVIAASGDCDEEIRGLLRQSCDVDVHNTPLDQVVNRLVNDWGIKLKWDVATLNEEKLAKNQLVSLKATGITRSSALCLMLARHKMGYCVRNGALQVTSAIKSYDMRFLRKYNVREFMPADGQIDFYSLIDFVHLATPPESWEGHDIRALEEGKTLALMINQTELMHNLIQTRLTELRRAREARKLQQRWSHVIGVNPADSRLHDSVDIDWINKPLPEALTDLADRMGLALEWVNDVDQKLLRPISLKAKKIDALSVLNKVTHNSKINFVTTQDGLQIVPAENPNDTSEYRWHDVSDFIRNKTELDSKLIESVMAAAKKRVGNAGWISEANGGTPTATEIGGLHLLPIRQTQAAHRAIYAELEKLRRARSARNPAAD